VLVVEDEFHMAQYVDEILRRMGMQVIGPVGTLRQAMVLAEAGGVDAALLDVRLRPDVRLPYSDRVYPVADLLRRRKIPFSFITAYEDHWIDRCPTDPVLRKPFREDQLQSAMRSLFCGDSSVTQQ
jgi:two-component SAPR family response regulator